MTCHNCRMDMVKAGFGIVGQVWGFENLISTL